MRRITTKKKKHGVRLVVTLCFVFCGFGCIGVAAQSLLTPRESRGKQIYVQGTSPTGKEILAYIGDSSLEVPGSSMACGNCHGLDGRGKPEGGIDPSNVTWEALTKPYDVVRPNGRKHPAYTDRAVELAITRGLDPAGNKLLNVMPRYQMSKDDLEDLVLYLKRLSKDRDAGIDDNKIVLGIVLPAKGPIAEMGEAMRAVTAAYFDEINKQGGIYNRRLELRFVESGETAVATQAKVEQFVKDEQIFALVAPFIAGAEKEFVLLADQNDIPLIGPMTLYPQAGFPLHREIFYLFSGINEQERALVNFLARKPEAKSSGLAVLYSQSELNERTNAAIAEQAKKNGLSSPEVFSFDRANLDLAGTVKRLREKDPEAVFFFGPGEQVMKFMREADTLKWFPSLYLTGSQVGSDIFDAPAGFSNKVFLAFPTSPADQTAEGMKEFRALAEKYHLSASRVAAQISAYSSTRILVEGLKRAGRDLSREKLIGTLESFDRFDTGLTPPITYGANRRIGALGAYVVSVDLEKKQFVPASQWITID
jgi:ABC-type branched-subunit amino acid transport system substrate-binding protein